ncbi:MAG: hypothetical protein M3N32_04455, partial [Actinomycetota bacterium]|nr:hypothetical protein [Actinomycetota bacterium]
YQNPILTGRERRIAATIAVGCVALAGLAGVPVVLSTGAGRGEALWSGLVYGALLASAAVVVYIDRLYARQCPRCGNRHHDRGAVTCLRCGYDLASRPCYTCPESHAVYLEPGCCECGGRLQRVAQAVVPGNRFTGRCLGVWILAFLACTGILLQLVGA